MRHKKTAFIKHGVGALLGLILVLWGMNEALTLFIVGGLALIAYNAYKLIRVKKAPDVQQDPLYQAQDEAHAQEMDKICRNILVTKLAFGIVCAICVCLLVATAFGGSVVPLLVVAVIGGVIKLVQSGQEDRLKKYVADNITRAALEEVFDIAEYRPFGCIDTRKLSGSDFGIGSFDRAGGNDYVCGTYNGLPIEMCDITLTERRTRTEEDGRTVEYDETVFSGFWLICDFGKELAADICLRERGKRGKLLGGGGIKTENEAFNKRFRIESAIEEEAFYILTPHMMEYILEMDRKADGDTHIRLGRGGKVHIAIGTDRDAFEIGKSNKDATELRRQFVSEIRYITDLIDELRLVDTLYRQGAASAQEHYK